MERVARSIRLPRDLWRRLDEAALEASAKSGRYVSANALIESALASHPSGADEPVDRASGLERMRAARRAKAALDHQRVARQQRFVRTLRVAGARRRREALEAAKATIESWRRDSLASPLYVTAWTQLVEAGLPAIERALRDGHAGLTPAALATNSPFIAAYRPAPR
jgi:hypothetical protein